MLNHVLKHVFSWWVCCEWSTEDACTNDIGEVEVIKWAFCMCYFFSPMRTLYGKQRECNAEWILILRKLEAIVEAVNTHSITQKKNNNNIRWNSEKNVNILYRKNWIKACNKITIKQVRTAGWWSAKGN